MNVNVRKRKGKKGITYYLDYYYLGKRYRETLQIPDSLKESERRKIAKKRSIKKQYELSNLVNNVISKTDTLYSELDLYVANYKKNDIRKIEAAVSFFKNWIEDKQLPFVDYDDVILFRSELIKTYKLSTAASYYKSIKKIFVRFKYQGKIKSSPFSQVKTITEKNETNKNVLTKPEIDKLISVPCRNEDVKRAFIFACYTGLGLAEVRSIQKTNVEGGFLAIERKKTKTKVLIPLNEYCRLELKRNGYQFKLPSDTAINKTLKKWIRRSGINKHITFYCARHSFATNLIRSGVDIDIVRQLMGHTGYQYIMRYLNRSQQEKIDAINKL